MPKGTTIALTVAAAVLFLMLALTPFGYLENVEGVDVEEGFSSSASSFSSGECIKMGDTAYVLSYTQFGDERTNRYIIEKFGLLDGRREWSWIRNDGELDWPYLMDYDLLEDDGRIYMKGWFYDHSNLGDPISLAIFEIDPHTMNAIESWTISMPGDPQVRPIFQRDGVLYLMPTYGWNWTSFERTALNDIIRLDLRSGELIDILKVPEELCGMYVLPFGDVALAFDPNSISDCLECDMLTGEVTKIETLGAYEGCAMVFNLPMTVCGDTIIVPTFTNATNGWEWADKMLVMDSSYNVVEERIELPDGMDGDVFIIGADEKGAMMMGYEWGTYGYMTYLVTPELSREPLMFAYIVPLAVLGVAAVVQFDKRWK
ncbi:MAG: hypothetical protein A4E30_00988 [Methanomassiliicoccales archaeon PtaB.Bin215]|nr:MAG: hypothetical protein A4E30_00988 [Methanomassiliicoccales archaeon PtaB.Bin215]